MVQTSNLFFPRPGKSKRLRLPICFFPAREKAKLLQISNLLFPNPGKSNRKSEEQLFLQRGQVTNMTCADLSQDLREPFATAVRAHSKSAFEIRSLTRKRWVFERRSYIILHTGAQTVLELVLELALEWNAPVFLECALEGTYVRQFSGVNVSISELHGLFGHCSSEQVSAELSGMGQSSL